MLPEPLRLLIAAYAADDLSPRRRKAAIRLLKHSREARRLLRALHADRIDLQALPKATLPADFADRVVARLPSRSPAMRPTATPVRGFSTNHIVAAFAVALVFGIGGWSLLVLQGDGTKYNTPVVNVTPKTDEPAVVVAKGANRPSDSFLDPSRYQEIPPSELPQESAPTSQPSMPPRDVLTAPAIPKLETVQVTPTRLTLVLAPHSLDSTESKAKLARDFALSSTHRIDLFAHDTSRGFDRLRTALREKGIRISVEAVAAEAHRKHTRGQTYVVFSEDLTAAEWVAALDRIGAADRRAEERKPGDGQFEAMTLMALATSDQKDLASLFGTDVSQPVAKPKTSNIDVRKPLADSTAQQIVDALDKAGRDRKPGDKVAIALSGSALRATPSTSSEIKQFLDGRRERPTAAIAVMLVVRQGREA